MTFMEVRSTVLCESCLISKQDVSYELCVYKHFVRSHRQNTTLARWSGEVWACCRWMYE
jgi:hypothetical protein